MENISCYLFFSVFASIARCQTDVDDNLAMCTFTSCDPTSPPSATFDHDCAAHEGYRIIGRCCIDESSGSIVGVDLSYCDLKSVGTVLHDAPNILKINFTHNSNLKFENNSFRGLAKLHTVALDLTMDCPGEWSWYNATWQSWNDTVMEKHQKRCVNQSNTCTKLFHEHNYTCPDHSECVNNGPGSFSCVCEENWGGYKCMRRTDSNPSLTIILSTSISTVVLSLILWVTQRRRAI